jgi:hypothetical protein
VVAKLESVSVQWIKVIQVHLDHTLHHKVEVVEVMDLILQTIVNQVKELLVTVDRVDLVVEVLVVVSMVQVQVVLQEVVHQDKEILVD